MRLEDITSIIGEPCLAFKLFSLKFKSGTVSYSYTTPVTKLSTLGAQEWIFRTRTMKMVQSVVAMVPMICYSPPNNSLLFNSIIQFLLFKLLCNSECKA